MQDYQKFLDSLPADLNPEEREAKIIEFVKTQDDEYKKLQSSTSQGVEQLKQRQTFVLQESKKVAQNPNYIVELANKDPDAAQIILSTFGEGITIDDVKSGKFKPVDDFDVKYAAKEAEKKEQEMTSKFIKAVSLTEEEEKAFKESLNVLKGDRTLSEKDYQTLMVSVAFGMGKKLSPSKELIMGEHNAIPSGGGSGNGGSGNGDSYDIENNPNIKFLSEAGGLNLPPKK